MGRKSTSMLAALAAAVVLQSACKESAADVRNPGGTLQEEPSVCWEQDAGEKETAEVAQKPAEGKEAVVRYEGEAFIKSVFAAGEDMLYLCGIGEDGSFFLGSMGQEETVFQKSEAEIPEGMRVFHMAVDGQGRCHVLCMSVEKDMINDMEYDRLTFEKSCILVIGRKGEPEASVDVSNVFYGEQSCPSCFAVDEEGNYYFENQDEIVKLRPDGSPELRAACAGRVEAIGCGESGEVWYIFADESEEKVLAGLKTDAEGVRLPRTGAAYWYIAPGTDGELILYNKEGGVFSRDGESGTAEQLIPGSDLPVPGRDVCGYGMLGDGRLCLMSQSGEDTVFYYIPVGR